MRNIIKYKIIRFNYIENKIKICIAFFASQNAQFNHVFNYIFYDVFAWK